MRTCVLRVLGTPGGGRGPGALAAFSPHTWAGWVLLASAQGLALSAAPGNVASGGQRRVHPAAATPALCPPWTPQNTLGSRPRGVDRPDKSQQPLDGFG